MALILAATATAVAAGAQSASAGAGPAPTPAEAEAIGREAYRYGLPLLEFLRVRRENTSVRAPDGSGNAPVNRLSNAAQVRRA